MKRLTFTYLLCLFTISGFTQFSFDLPDGFKEVESNKSNIRYFENKKQLPFNIMSIQQFPKMSTDQFNQLFNKYNGITYLKNENEFIKILNSQGDYYIYKGVNKNKVTIVMSLDYVKMNDELFKLFFLN